MSAEKETSVAVEPIDYAKLAVREVMAHWMRTNGFATGHGDTLYDLLRELEWQVNELKIAAMTSTAGLTGTRGSRNTYIAEPLTTRISAPPTPPTTTTGE